MFYKKIVRPMAFTLGLGIGIGASVSQTDALTVTAFNRNELLSKIKLTSHKGTAIQEFGKISKPLLPMINKGANRPATWNDFITITSQHFKLNTKFLLDYNVSNSQSIITKSEISSALKLLVESNNGVKLSSTSAYKLERLVNTLNSSSNYLQKSDLENIVNKGLVVNDNGDLVEKVTGKINNFSGQFINILRTESHGQNALESYALTYRAPWKWDNSKVYEFTIEGNSITFLESITDLEYGIVSSNGTQSKVNDKVIPTNFNVKNGDYIEYYESKNSVVLTANYGSYEGSFLVKDTTSQFVNTYEGNKFSVSNITLIDKDGLPVNRQTLERGSIITKFGNYFIVDKESSKHSIRIHGKHIYIDNVIYELDSMWIDTGVKLSKSNNLHNREYILEGEVYWDLFGNPVKVEVSKANLVGTYVRTQNNKLVLNIGGKEQEFGYSLNLGQLKTYKYYSFIVVDENIVQAEELKSKTVYVNTLQSNYFFNNKDKIYVDNSTPVLEIRNNSTINNRLIKYSDLYKKFDDEIKVGYSLFRVYYLDESYAEFIEVEYFPSNYPAGNVYLKSTPLSVYKLESFRILSNDQLALVLSDGVNVASLTTSDLKLSEGLRAGDYVVAEFSSRNIIYDMYKFELTDTNITQEGLAEYLGLNGTNVTRTTQVVHNSDIYHTIKNTQVVYEYKNKSFVELPIQEPMRVGREYFTLSRGLVTKIQIVARY